MYLVYTTYKFALMWTHLNNNNCSRTQYELIRLIMMYLHDTFLK